MVNCEITRDIQFSKILVNPGTPCLLDLGSLVSIEKYTGKNNNYDTHIYGYAYDKEYSIDCKLIDLLGTNLSDNERKIIGLEISSKDEVILYSAECYSSDSKLDIEKYYNIFDKAISLLSDHIVSEISK